jgi:hypothetical protein
MRDIIVDLNSLDTRIIFSENYIKEGENKASNLIITLNPEFIDIAYSYKIKFKLNDNAPVLTEDLVPVEDVITYTITNVNTFEMGSLRCELQAYDIDNTLLKSASITLNVIESVDGLAVEVPTDYEIYITMIEHYMDNVLYDPSLKEVDVYDMDNMDESATKKIYTVIERAKLDDIIGDVNANPDTYVIRDGIGGTQIGHIDFDTNPTADPLEIGRMQWSETDGTVTIGIGTAEIEINQAQFMKAQNLVGRTIQVGEVVAINGSNNDVPTFILADADGSNLSKNVFGLVSIESVIDGDIGSVLTQGMVHNVDTSLFVDGDELYLDVVGGQMTTIMPLPPAEPIFVGYCIKASLQGEYDGIIYVIPVKYPSATKVSVFDDLGYYDGTTAESVFEEIGYKLQKGYGEIYTNVGATPQTVLTGAGYTKLTPVCSVGLAVNATPSALNQNITIDLDGVYNLSYTASSEVSVNAVLYYTIFRNGVQLQNISASVTRTKNIYNVIAIGGIVECQSGDVLDIRFRHNAGVSVIITQYYTNFSASIV